MGQPIRTAAEWAEVHATAVALGSIRAAAKAHGVSEDAAYQRARREKWLVGTPASVQAAREQRIERAEAAGVTVSERVRATPGPDILHQQITGIRATNAGRVSASNNQRRRPGTAHEASVAQSPAYPRRGGGCFAIHPDQFGTGATSSGAQQQDAQRRVEAALKQVFGVVRGFVLLGGDAENAATLEDTGGHH